MSSSNLLLITIVLLSFSKPVLVQGQILETITDTLVTDTLVTDPNSNRDTVSLPPAIPIIECIPPCRAGYVCKDGDCVSRCNPPCPDNAKCDTTGECHSAISFAEQKKIILSNITQLTRVNSAEDVVQGMIIRTNVPNSVAHLKDQDFLFDNELFLNAPANDYNMLLDAKGKNTKFGDGDLDSGMITVVDSRLRAIRLISSFSMGAIFIGEYINMTVTADVGLDISSKFYIGLTFNGMSTFDTLNNSGYYDATMLSYSGYSRVEYSDFYGCGIAYGYTGMHFLRNLTFVPKIAAGYWLNDNLIEEARWNTYTGSSYKYNYHKEAIHEYEHYFIKPGVEIRFGYRVVGFKLSADMFLGDAFGPVFIGAGVVLRIL